MNNEQFVKYLEDEYQIKLDELIENHEDDLNSLLDQIKHLNNVHDKDEFKLKNFNSN